MTLRNSRPDWGHSFVCPMKSTTKYRQTGEDFYSKVVRITGALKDDSGHIEEFKTSCATCASANWTGAERYGSRTEDHDVQLLRERHFRFDGQHHARATEAAETMRRGGGIGYDFSRIRPRGDLIKSLESQHGCSSWASTTPSVRQSHPAVTDVAHDGCLRIDHPDIEQFITAKANSDKLTGFNLHRRHRRVHGASQGQSHSHSATKAVSTKRSTLSPVGHGDGAHGTGLNPASCSSTINEMNNLHYCETIETRTHAGATFASFGACLLGNFNLVKYVDHVGQTFDWDQFRKDIRVTSGDGQRHRPRSTAKSRSRKRSKAAHGPRHHWTGKCRRDDGPPLCQRPVHAVHGDGTAEPAGHCLRREC